MRLLIATSVLLIGSVLAAQVIRQENVATTKQLMETLVIPASNAVFEAAGKDNPTEADWQEFRKNALILAESANLLLSPGRASTGAIRGEAKAKGKVRHVGVTGHHDPDILTRAVMDWPVDTVMMPVNPVEGVIGGFLTQTLPAAKSKGLGIIGMKILGAGMAWLLKKLAAKG
mgnify:CR=1 FL=1